MRFIFTDVRNVGEGIKKEKKSCERRGEESGAQNVPVGDDNDV